MSSTDDVSMDTVVSVSLENEDEADGHRKKIEAVSKKKNQGRSSAAQNAFLSGDAEASRALHAATSVTEEGHKKGGDFIKSVVYGSMDGLITTFAVVTAVVGGDLHVGTVLILGFANMLGDGISMGVGDYLSSSAEYEFAKRERAREMWECENDIEAERKEMVELYALKPGISAADAKTVVDIISKDYHTFVDIMMVEELGLMPPDDADASWKNGLVTFAAFCFCGSIPLLPYIAHVAVFGPDGPALPAHPAFGVAVALTGITMFLLGAATSRFTAQHWMRAGLFTMANGGLAAAASYGIAVLVKYLFDVNV